MPLMANSGCFYSTAKMAEPARITDIDTNNVQLMSYLRFSYLSLFHRQLSIDSSNITRISMVIFYLIVKRSLHL